VGEPPRAGPDPGEARTARRRYDRIAPVYDLLNRAGERLRYRRWRPMVWERAFGRVLEVGVGTGANLPHIPDGSRVIGIDVSGGMLARGAERLREEGSTASLVQMDAQALGFGDGSFDSAVATCVFCSVPDPIQGLREVRRTLKPEGRLVLLEHVRSPRPWLGRVMDWLNPLVVRTMGVNINRDTVENVRRAGFGIQDVRSLDGLGNFKLIEAAPSDPGPTEGKKEHP
jgi:ubiquinone/menaquinone biosynthesis C-methylase UbiE